MEVPDGECGMGTGWYQGQVCKEIIINNKLYKQRVKEEKLLLR